MAKYNLHTKGSIDDARNSLRFIELNATSAELWEEIAAERKGKNRVSLINMIRAAIRRKSKK